MTKLPVDGFTTKVPVRQELRLRELGLHHAAGHACHSVLPELDRETR